MTSLPNTTYLRTDESTFATVRLARVQGCRLPAGLAMQASMPRRTASRERTTCAVVRAGTVDGQLQERNSDQPTDRRLIRSIPLRR